MTDTTNTPSTFSLNPFRRGSAARTRWIPQMPRHLHVQFAHLARELDVVGKARAEAAENRPRSDDTAPDDVQRSIWNPIAEAANLLRQFLADQLANAEEKARHLLPQELRFQAAEADARSQLAENRLSHRERLVSLRLAERKRLRDLMKFRRDNLLSRDAAYDAGRWGAATWLLAVFTFESVANGALFQKVSPWGLAGGIGIACLVSFVTIAFGYLAGFVGVRLLRYVRLVPCLFGGLALIVCVTGGIGWNLLVARFRDLVEAHPDDTIFDLFKVGSVQEWLSLSSLESWALLLVGLLSWLVAMLKGAGGHGCFADPYWNYASEDRAYRADKQALDDAKNEFRAEVTQMLDAARGVVEESLRRTRGAAAELHTLLGHAEQRAVEVADSTREWVAAGVRLIKLYQQENRAVRTSPPPTYFTDEPAAEDVMPSMPSLEPLRALVAEADRRLTENERVWALYQDRLTEFAHTELEQFLDFIAEIESESDRAVAEDWAAADGEAPRPRAAVALVSGGRS